MKDLTAMYQKSLPFQLEAHLYRSESWHAFIAWLSSDDRAAQDLTAIIREHNLSALARAWVAKRREVYQNNPEQFQRDRKSRLLNTPKNVTV